MNERQKGALTVAAIATVFMLLFPTFHTYEPGAGVHGGISFALTRPAAASTDLTQLIAGVVMVWVAAGVAIVLRRKP